MDPPMMMNGGGFRSCNTGSSLCNLPEIWPFRINLGGGSGNAASFEARREKISERMKILQDLVPGCNKVIGKALVLDEIINYIQSLQQQVEFLSMKLEAVTSRSHPSPQGFTSKDYGQETFEMTGVPFGSQPTRSLFPPLLQQYPPFSFANFTERAANDGFERGRNCRHRGYRCCFDFSTCHGEDLIAMSGSLLMALCSIL